MVERPASVVKELVENALDAGASRVDVLTDGGGRRLIRVADDGEGMVAADLVLAVERHATSKLADDDLVSIRTLGFRGEALPSIGAVARLVIATRHKSEPHAWSIDVDAGAKSDLKPAALGEGTRVEVRDLFYATPARLKFLKLDRTEAEAVREVVRRLAMSRPDVAFTLAGEERAPVTFAATLPGAASLTRLGDVLGADFRANAAEVFQNAKALKVEGFAALPTLARTNALGQYLFVNDRPVRDKLLLGAVRAAYADYLPRDRHPLVALFVTLDPRELDVNVHPAKTEVRFRNAGLVRALLVHALKAALTREGTRAATTGGSATIAAFRPEYGAYSSSRTPGTRRGGYDWRRSPARPAIRAAQVHFRPAAALPRRLRRRSMWALRRLASRPPLPEIRASAWLFLRRLRLRPSSIRSAPPARKCTRPISLRKRATGSSSSINTPPMSASSTKTEDGAGTKRSCAPNSLNPRKLSSSTKPTWIVARARGGIGALRSCLKSSGLARWRCEKLHRCSAKSTARCSFAIWPSIWANGTRHCRSTPPDARRRHHGVSRLGARRAAAESPGNERASARDGSHAQFRPMQSRAPTYVELKLTDIERLFGRR